MKQIKGRYTIIYSGDPRKGDDVIVQMDGVRIRSFNSLSDDYAYTNAREFVDQRIKQDAKEIKNETK